MRFIEEHVVNSDILNLDSVHEADPRCGPFVLQRLSIIARRRRRTFLAPYSMSAPQAKKKFGEIKGHYVVDLAG